MKELGMDEALEDEIRELLAAGNKIAAVKRFREQTGVGLAEALAVVEAIGAGRSSLDQTALDDTGLASEVVSLLERGSKIEAIKRYREQTGVGLKEAKDAVERIGEQNGIRAASGAGCFGVVLLTLAAGAVLSRL